MLVEHSSPSMHTVKFCHHWAFGAGDIATPCRPLLEVLRLWWDPAHAKNSESISILFWGVLSVCRKQWLSEFLLWWIIFLYLDLLGSKKGFTRLLLFVISIKGSFTMQYWKRRDRRFYKAIRQIAVNFKFWHLWHPTSHFQYTYVWENPIITWEIHKWKPLSIWLHEFD